MNFFDKDIKELLSIISSINIEIDFCITEYGDYHKKGNAYHAIRANKDIESVLKDFLNTFYISTDKIDILFSALSQEFVGVRHYGDHSFLTIKRKHVLDSVSDRFQIDASNSLPKIDAMLKHISALHGKYQTEKISALIVVAVPVEFRAIYRKFSIITKIENDYIWQALEKSKDSNEERQSFWVEGIIFKEEKYIKILVQFSEKYGSISTQTKTSEILNEFKGIPEISLIGVAGHMSDTNDVKIGDLAISTGFYNAYDQKLKNNDNISYTNKSPIIPKSNYIEHIEKLGKWKPSNLIETKPEITIPDFERKGESQIHKGYYVSGPPVVKNAKHKENILEHFKNTIAVEMEAAGCYEIAKKFNMEFMIIKAVCDWSNETKSKEWQPFCAALAAEFVVDYLIEKYGRD